MIRPREVLQGAIARGAAGTLGLRVLHAGLRLLISLALARLLGASGYGAYAFALAWVGMLSVPALLGLDGLLVREVANYRQRGLWGPLNGLLRFARRSALLASGTTALGAAGAAWLLAPGLEPTLLRAFWIGLLALPLLALLRLDQALLSGLRRVVAGQIPELLVHPVAFLIFAGLAIAVAGARLDAGLAVALYVGAALAALVPARLLAGRARAAAVVPAEPEELRGPWLRAAGNFALVGAMGAAGAALGAMMLGPMAGAAATGVFGIANAAAGLVALPLIAINVPLAPAVSSRFAEGDTASLQRMATRAARSALLLSLPAALLFLAFGKPILGLFGPEFVAGYPALCILSLAQVFNAGMGSVGVLLQMTGHERDVTLGCLGGLALNVSLNLALIPTLGPTGAALGAAANLVFLNLIFFLCVRRKLSLRPTAAG